MIALPKRNLNVKLDLDRMSQFEDYDLSKPVNMYSIRDVEVERMFRYFIESSSFLLGEHGMERTDGYEKYASYIYSSMLLSEFIQGELDVVADRAAIPNEPVAFLEFMDMTVNGDISDGEFIRDAYHVLERAEKEMLMVASTYLSHKYREPFPVMFDGQYLANGFHRAGEDFRASEYDMHLTHLKALVGDIEFVTAEAEPPTFYMGEVHYFDQDGANIGKSEEGVVDTVYGTVVADGLREALDKGVSATMVVNGVEMEIERNDGAELFAIFPPSLSDVDTIVDPGVLIEHLNRDKERHNHFGITVSLMDDEGHKKKVETAVSRPSDSDAHRMEVDIPVMTHPTPSM